MRMDLGQREVPEREAHATGELRLDPLDRAVRLARIRTLVIAVLDDQPSARGSANVVTVLQRLDHRAERRLAELAVKVYGGADERQVGEGLGEVAELLTRGPDLLGVEA